MKYWKIVLVGWVLSGLTVSYAEVKNDEAAPEFTLTDTKGIAHKLSDFKGKYVVLEWVNHGCPFVVKHYSQGHMQALQKAQTADGVIWLSICSSAEGKQGHMTSDEWNAKITEVGSASTAVLIDEDGTVGKRYGAKVTPHLYVIDPAGILIYQGAIDSIRSTDAADIADAKNYVTEALAQHKAGQPVAVPQTQAYGCGIKYKN